MSYASCQYFEMWLLVCERAMPMSGNVCVLSWRKAVLPSSLYPLLIANWDKRIMVGFGLFLAILRELRIEKAN